MTFAYEEIILYSSLKLIVRTEIYIWINAVNVYVDAKFEQWFNLFYKTRPYQFRFYLFLPFHIDDIVDESEFPLSLNDMAK